MTGVIDTASVPEHQRVEYWQTVCREVIGTFECRDLDSKAFHSSLEIIQIDDLKIGRFRGAKQTLERRRSHFRSGDTDDFIVMLGSSEVFQFEQNGRQRLGRGGITLVDIARPYFSHHSNLNVIDVFVPRKRLEAVLGSGRLAAGLTIEKTQPSFPILSAFLRSIAEHAPSLDPAGAARMATIAVDLIAAGFAERVEQEPSRSFTNASILCRAKSYIDANLSRAGLGMADIAASGGLSVRRLHEIALEESISLIDWLWERRLTRARRLLGDPAQRGLSIGAVAHMCGFADQAHFARRFKGRFGQTPREVRSGA